ncbi:MAG: aldehyde dehydrogenase family protein [Phycisphaerales bacterium]
MGREQAENDRVWTLSRRVAWVRAFRKAVSARRVDLCALMEDEVGKPAYQGLGSDILPLLLSCVWHEKRGWKLLRPTRVGGVPLVMTGLSSRELRVPIAPWDGPDRVAIIATWNYPVQLLGIQLVQAILAGNRVVVKPSENAPRTQQLLLEVARDAGGAGGAGGLGVSGLPPGVLEWTAATRDAAREVLASGTVKHVVFTGSTRVGRQIAAWAAENLVTSTLELSGADSAFVLADADVDLAASQLWDGVTINAGQTCMAPRRILVERAAYPAFIAALAPLAAAAQPVRLISAEAAARCHAVASGSLVAGARSLSGVIEPPDARDGRWLRPLALADCPTAARATPAPGMAELLSGAHFGPIVAIVPVESVAQALEVHRRCDQHLSASIFSRNVGAARDLAPLLGASQVAINSCLFPTGHPATSLGGRGPSGWGTSRGTHGLLDMTRAVFASALPTWVPRASVTGGSARMLGALQTLLDTLYGRRAPGGAAPLPSPDTVGGTRGNAPPTTREPTRAAQASVHSP